MPQSPPPGGRTARHRIVVAVADSVRRFYFDREVGARTSRSILDHERDGAYAGKKSAELAEKLTDDLRLLSHDMHLEVVFSERRLPVHPGPPSAEVRAAEREQLLSANCMIEKAQVLVDEVGYIKISFFADPEVCSSKIRDAMAALDGSRSLIFDLRNCRGGFPETVSLVAGYLFDHREYLFNPREAPSVNSWTTPVAGSHLTAVPVFILTSHETLSGAEQFSYDMKMLKRATLVGETTGGGAHAGVFHRISEHFGIAIPEVKTVNPFSDRDWETTGVEPDLRVPAGDALETALTRARGNSPR